MLGKAARSLPQGSGSGSWSSDSPSALSGQGPSHRPGEALLWQNEASSHVARPVTEGPAVTAGSKAPSQPPRRLLAAGGGAHRGHLLPPSKACLVVLSPCTPRSQGMVAALSPFPDEEPGSEKGGHPGATLSPAAQLGVSQRCAPLLCSSHWTPAPRWPLPTSPWASQLEQGPLGVPRAAPSPPAGLRRAGPSSHEHRGPLGTGKALMVSTETRSADNSLLGAWALEASPGAGAGGVARPTCC